jgi:hypothetical protein
LPKARRCKNNISIKTRFVHHTVWLYECNFSVYFAKPAAKRSKREKGLPKSTKKSIVDGDTYNTELVETYRRGYAVDQEKIYEGVSGVAAPVFTSGGES